MNCNCNKCKACCDNCIADTLELICTLQANTCCENASCCCNKPYLGTSSTCATLNTRPIVLYVDGGGNTPLQMPTTNDTITCGETAVCSSVFRIESINGCCATFRVLAENTDETSAYPYVATNSCFTMNVNSIIAIRCLEDTYVECI